MKPRNFLILLALILVIGVACNWLALRSWQEVPDGGAEVGAVGGSGLPARLSAQAQKGLRERGWFPAVAGGAAGGKAVVFQSGIARESLGEFERVKFPDGVPAYEGEPVTAFVLVPSTGKKVALTSNQSGEYPKVLTEPGEAVEVRLAFTRSAPGDPVAVSAQDGGVLHVGKMAGKLEVDAQREISLGFLVSPNPGIHRITFTTGGGEAKTLNFWAGPEHTVNKRIVAQVAEQKAGK